MHAYLPGTGTVVSTLPCASIEAGASMQSRHILTPPTKLSPQISSYFENRPRVPIIHRLRNRIGAHTEVSKLRICVRLQKVRQKNIEFLFSPREKIPQITFSLTGSPLFIIYLSSDSKATTNPTNLIMSDNRQIVGSIVHAKAIHVTNDEAECGQRYVRNKWTKLVQGLIAEVHNCQSWTGRSRCFHSPVTLIFWGGRTS
jgi:hypothetical protein